MSNRETGGYYEKLAATYLVEQDYKIIATNFRYERKEIDIICSKNNILVFVEVKGGRSQLFGAPIARVDKRKQKAIAAVAAGYLQEVTVDYESYRFDVIVVTEAGQELQIEHLPNAFTL